MNTFRLQGKKHKVVKYDAQDAEKIFQHKWYFVGDCKSGHAYTKFGRKTVYLHRYLLDVPEGLVVDHINRDGLDCRRSNMRVVTAKENARNLPVPKHNTSGYRGIRWNKRESKWRVEISGEYIGDFKDFELAKQARFKEEDMRGFIR